MVTSDPIDQNDQREIVQAEPVQSLELSQEAPPISQQDISNVFEKNKSEFQQNVRYIYGDEELSSDDKKQIVGEERIAFTQNLVKEWLGKDLKEQVTVQQLVDGLESIKSSPNYQEILRFISPQTEVPDSSNLETLVSSIKESSRDIIQAVINLAEENTVIPDQLIQLLALKVGIDAENLKLLQNPESQESLGKLLDDLAGRVDIGVVFAHVLKKKQSAVNVAPEVISTNSEDSTANFRIISPETTRLTNTQKDGSETKSIVNFIENDDIKGLFKTLDAGLAKSLDKLDVPHLLDIVFNNSRYIGSAGSRSNLEYLDDSDKSKEKGKKIYKTIKDITNDPEKSNLFYNSLLGGLSEDGSSNSHRMKERFSIILTENDPEKKKALTKVFKENLLSSLKLVMPVSDSLKIEDIYLLDTTEKLLIDGARKTTSISNSGKE